MYPNTCSFDPFFKKIFLTSYEKNILLTAKLHNTTVLIRRLTKIFYAFYYLKICCFERKTLLAKRYDIS